YLNDPEAEIRATLCDIIASFGDPEAIPRLTPLINDPSQTVADKANRAVERLRRTRAPKGSRGEPWPRLARSSPFLSWCRAAKAPPPGERTATCPAPLGKV